MFMSGIHLVNFHLPFKLALWCAFICHSLCALFSCQFSSKKKKIHKSKMSERTIGDRIALEVYPLIKSEHPCWPVIIYGIIIAVLTISGIVFNFVIIFVTILTKSFRRSVNILLAFYSLAEIVHLSGNFLSIFTAFSGHYFMPFKSAFYFVIAPLIGAGSAQNLMLFIGIERLFVVLFPLKNFNHKIFLAIVFKFILIYVIFTSITYSKCFDEKFDSIEIFANYYEIVQKIYDSIKWEYSFLVLVGLAILVITIFIYALIAVALHGRKVPSNANSAHFNKRIFRSLFTILSANFGGYLIAFFEFLVILPMAHDNAMALWHITQISGILVHISVSSNGPILYWTSSEYREAFQKTFAILFKAFGKSSAVVPQTLFTRNVLVKNSAQTTKF